MKELAKVIIDLNVRIGHNLTFSGYEDMVLGRSSTWPRVGESVWAVEKESQICAPAIVTWKDPEARLIYLAVAWAEFDDLEVYGVTLGQVAG